jgi:DNA-directed RNA polymerase subunit RPC12/RpoP
VTSGNPYGAQEQLPLLCAGCGGPGQLQADGSLRCPYCGRVERLAANDLDRMLEMRKRLSAAAAQAEQCHGVSRALFSIFESRNVFGGFIGIYFGFAGLVLVYSALSAAPYLAKASDAFLPLMIVHVLIGPLFVLALPVSLVFAMTLGRRRYRKEIRPIFMARPPETQGAPARCRVCGAGLPDSKDALLSCKHCHTTSLVTPELKIAVERNANTAMTWHRGQSMAASAATSGIARSMTRLFTITVIVMYIAQAGCIGAAGSLLSP